MSAITAKASRKMKKYAVLTREPRCFLGSFDFSWEQRKLGELVDRVVRKNTNNESTLPLTISAQYGLVDQITYFNNRVASRDVSNYYLVLNGEFAYNKSTSDGYPFGAVKRLDLYEKGVLSTLYIVFAPKKEQQIDSDYLTVFFDTDRWHKGVAERAAEGARNHGLLNISAEDFFDIDLSVPKDIVEQKQIGAFIRQLDNLITLHQRKCVFLFGFFQAVISMIFTASTFSWEQRKFSELVQIERGGSPRPIDDFITDAPNGLNWVKIGDAPTQGNYITKTAEKIRPEGLSKTREVHPGDLILSNSMSFGKPYIMGIDGCIHDGWLLIRNTYGVFDLTFLCHLLGTPQMLSQYRSLAAGSTVNNLNKELVGNTYVTIPSITEQRVLGAYLEQLDNLITLHQRECISFTARAGRRILTANKKRNTSSWEQRKLNEVVNVYDGVHQTPDYKESGVMFLSVENISTLKSEKYISEEAFQRDYKVYPQKGDILMTRIGDVGTPNVVETTEKVAFYVSLALLKPTKINSYFLCNSIQSPLFQKGLKDRTLVTAIPQKINKDEIGKVNIILPTSSQEQQLIGEYFANLDRLITLHQRKPFLMKWRTSDANRNKTNRLVL